MTEIIDLSAFSIMMGYRPQDGYRVRTIVDHRADDYLEQTGKVVTMTKVKRQWQIPKQEAVDFTAWINAHRKAGTLRAMAKKTADRKAGRKPREKKKKAPTLEKKQEERTWADIIRDAYAVVAEEHGEALRLIGFTDPFKPRKMRATLGRGK